MEALILAHPSLAWRTLASNVAARRHTMLMEFEGDPEALRAVEEEYGAKKTLFMERWEILHRGRRRLLVFAVERSGKHPLDISVWVQRVLGPDTIVSISKTVEGATWRILTPRQEKLPEFLRHIRAAGIHLEHQLERPVPLYELAAWSSNPVGPPPSGLTSSETAMLAAAHRMGYYDSPKRASVSDVAKRLRMPRSTLHDRLARAERKVVEAALGQARAGG